MNTPSPFLFFSSLLLGLSTLILTVSCHDSEPSASTRQPLTREARRTVIVYMAAQNTLGRGGYQRADSAEMMAGRHAIAPEDRLLVFIDDQQSPRLYRIDSERDTPELLRTWEEDICSTAPERLKEVIGETAALAPAREYGLVLWSHATGWVPATEKDYDRFEPSRESPSVIPFSFGIDSGPEGGMTDKGAQTDIDDLAEALAATGRHFRYIFFDACLMQNVEVAYALRDVTDYIVASPAQTPAAGADYTREIEQGLFSYDPCDIARTYLADVVSPERADSYGDFGLTLSVVRTAALQPLANVLRETLTASALSEGRMPEMNNVLNYQAYTDQYGYRPHNYDMRQALRLLLPTAEAERAEEALNDVIAFHGATADFWIGPYYFNRQSLPSVKTDYCCLSMFVPQAVYTNNASFGASYGDLNKVFRQTAWYTAAGFDRIGH